MTKLQAEQNPNTSVFCEKSEWNENEWETRRKRKKNKVKSLPKWSLSLSLSFVNVYVKSALILIIQHDVLMNEVLAWSLSSGTVLHLFK